VKCYDLKQCSEQERQTCYVWNCFRNNPEEMENIRCWVLKNVYHPDNRELLKKCLKCNYYLMMNRQAEPVTGFDPEIALIKCDGVVNYEKTRGISDVWEKLKATHKTKVALDLSSVNNIYSCGLGIIVKIHKECEEAGGMLAIVGVQSYVKATFDSTKLSRLLHLVPDARGAGELFDSVKKKQVEEAAKKQAEIEAAKPKIRPPCWEYFKNHNPRNATACDECFRKINPSNEPCWIVDGVIEGVSFQYVNDDCEDCPYCVEWGSKVARPKELKAGGMSGP